MSDDSIQFCLGCGRNPFSNVSFAKESSDSKINPRAKYDGITTKPANTRGRYEVGFGGG